MSPSTPLTIAEVDALSVEGFVDLLGGVFEHSSWIAEVAAGNRPFRSPAALHAGMVAVVENAGLEKQIALIAEHPDLAGRLAEAGELTAESTSEQAAAGLGSMEDSQRQELGELNTRYREKFGFPFVICARMNAVETILKSATVRVENTREEEIETALQEIYKIAELRLADHVLES